MDKTALNAQLATTGLKRVFITSNVLTAKDQICGKVLVWLPTGPQAEGGQLPDCSPEILKNICIC